ncbi:hypothetical protein D9M68_187790 [compost metagenome]
MTIVAFSNLLAFVGIATLRLAGFNYLGTQPHPLAFPPCWASRGPRPLVGVRCVFARARSKAILQSVRSLSHLRQRVPT